MNLKKFLLKSGAAAAVAAFSAVAAAVPLTPTFTFDPGAGEQGTLGAFVANNIGAEYSETISFGAGTFEVSIAFVAQTFSLKDTDFTANYSATQTGLTTNYNIYGLFQSSGTWSTSGGVTTFLLDSGVGNFELYLDKNADSANPVLPFNFFNQPGDGSAFYTVAGNSADDVLLASGIAVNGIGSTGSGPNLSGSFGQTTTFSLTEAGEALFIAPRPFYELVFASGQFEGFPVAEGVTTRLTGTLNAVFAVPEPGSLALVGMALMGLGLSRKRK